jgi:outer membrane protein TolC
MRKSADNEVTKILLAKSRNVPNAGKTLHDIAPPPPVSLGELRTNEKTEVFLGDRAGVDKGARIIPLTEALKIAVTHSRSYRTQKESLFLGALDLTSVRHDFAPIFSATGSSDYLNTQTPTVQTIQVPNPAYAKAQAAAAKAASAAAASSTPATTTTTTAAAPVAVPQFLQKQITTLVTDNTLSSQGNIGFSVLASTGARLAADLTTDFLRFVTGNLTKTSDSSLAVTLTQPLLRGAGYRATMETLTQAERDLLYSIRDFSQYRKSFTVDITSQYYQTLQARDAARNAHFAFTAFTRSLDTVRALNLKGRAPTSQVGLIEAAVLRYKRQWINAIRSYEQALDDLKLSLAVPVETPIMLDQKDLDSLSIEDPEMTLDQAVQTAMVTRLDLYNSRNRLEDTTRRVKLAEQDLLPQLDLKGRYQVSGNPKSDQVNLNFDRRKLGAGLDLDLRLDKKADRNAYRAALISQQKAARDTELAEEQVKAQIRSDWRDLDVARKQFEISKYNIERSERRLEEESLKEELGTGTARDLIDAQQDLIGARDALVSALVSHTINRLKLWRDMGVLYIKKDGSWINVLKNEAKLASDD